MLGAIIGDIVGSRFEFNNHRSKDFELFTENCFVTDDSIMTFAVAKALMETEKIHNTSLEAINMNFVYLGLLQENTVKMMQRIGRKYPNCGYGGRFHSWIFSADPKPYNSFGNGAAMRISSAAYAGRTEEEVLSLSETITSVSHDHEEGLKGAEAAALCIFLARKGLTKLEIRRRIERDYYPLDFTIDEIRDTYAFNETCQDTVPQAIKAFLESTSFEDAVRTGISVGGDSDTLAAITGSIAEAYYGIPSWIAEKALTYLDERLYSIYVEWETFIGWEKKVSRFHILTKYIGKMLELQSLGELESSETSTPENKYRRPIPYFDELADQFAEEFLHFLENRLEYAFNRSGTTSFGGALPWEHDSFRYAHADSLTEEQILSILMDMLRIYKVDKEVLFKIMEDGSLLKLLKKLKTLEDSSHVADPEEIIFEIGGFFDGKTRHHIRFDHERAIMETTSRDLDSGMSMTFSKEATEELLGKFGALHVECWNHEYVDPHILDGTGWTLSVKYKGHRGTVWSGLNAYPPNWDALLALFCIAESEEAPIEK